MFKERVCIPSCDHSNEKIPIHASFSCSDFIRGVPETEHWNVITKQGFELEKINVIQKFGKMGTNK